MMKLCRTCRYGSEYELDKPCIVYRDDCPLYEKEGDGMIKLTNRQAIGVLDGLWSNPLFGDSHRQAFEIGIKAIKALEQEPCDDAISRQAVLDELNKWDWQELYLPIHFKENIIDVVPSVNPQAPKGKCLLSQKYRDWLFIQEPQTGHCTDCKHYMSGEQDGSCDSYICEHYSNWESEDKE